MSRMKPTTEEAILEHAGLVTAYIRKHLSNPRLQDDAVQHGLLKLTRRCQRGPINRGEAYTLANTAMLDFLRMEYRQRAKFPLVSECDALELAAARPDPDAERQDLREAVFDALRSVDKTKSSILWKVFECGSFAELGRVLGVSRQAAWGRVKHAALTLPGLGASIGLNPEGGC